MSFIKTVGYKLDHFMKTRIQKDRPRSPYWYASETCPWAGKRPTNPVVKPSVRQQTYIYSRNSRKPILETKCPGCGRIVCMQGERIIPHKTNPKTSYLKNRDKAELI